MYVEDGLLKDDDGRTLLLRGINIGGSSKVPRNPDGASYRMRGFFDHTDVSFVGRPFPLDEADEHFMRLKTWGLIFIRLIVTWEAIEHQGPGKYDHDYLDYLEALIDKADKYDLKIIIDPHQDVWCRWTGGDGAPGWTLEVVGIDPTKIHSTGAALVHNQYDQVYPKMIWPTNYTRFGAATMFTLFFGGNVFAPKTKIGTVPVQEFLQNHYINAFRTLAQRLRRFPNVFGYGCMNEPHPGFIGWGNLNDVTTWELKNGPSPTPFQSMVACSGLPQNVESYSFGLRGVKKTGEVVINPEGISLWKMGQECIWRENGVWSLEYYTPRLLKPRYFDSVHNQTVNFNNDFLKPFLKRFYRGIISAVPSACIFLEGVPGETVPRWYSYDGHRVVNASHWYDSLTLMNKRYIPWLGYDSIHRRIVIGKRRVRASFIQQLDEHIRNSKQKMGSIPTVIGEFGVPFDINNKKAFRNGNFSDHEEALDSYYNAMDKLLLHSFLWNYTSDNTNKLGDLWNGEDLSIFSRDQQKKPEDIHSGGRAISGFCRPHPQKIAGTPLFLEFIRTTKEFTFAYRPDTAIDAPTELYVPHWHYPDGYVVNISAGSYKKDTRNQRLLVYHSNKEDPLTVIVSPAKS